MRGMPYGTHATAPLAIGSPFAAASASAFRFASNGPAYCGFSTSGVAAGAASFGSAPRPPRYVAHTPARSTCADAVVAIEAIAIATAAPSLKPLALVISLLPPHRAVGQHAAVRHRDARQERARLSALERADDGHHFVAELEILELPSGLLEDARAAEFDGPVLDGAGIAGHVQFDVRVRIGPLERGDGADEGDGLRRVEHRERVMQQTGQEQGDHAAEYRTAW